MICHWDEVASGRAEAGHIAGEWTDLGEAAGTKTVGLNRIRIDPRKWSTPFHRRTAEEEIFYVLAGTGICLLDGSAFEVRPRATASSTACARHTRSARTTVLTCWRADEEIFVVLEGEGLLELWPTPQLSRGGREYEEQPIRAGQVISRPASTGVAHGFRAGEPGMTYLSDGTRNPNDACYYPRSKKISFRGLGLIARLEDLDYDHGEPQ